MISWTPTRDRDQTSNARQATCSHVLSLRPVEDGGQARCIVQIMPRQSYIYDLPPGLVESCLPYLTNGQV